MQIRRGDIYYADLSPVVGSEQGGLRPVLIIQNDVGNRYSPTVIAAAITSQMTKAKLPTHIDIFANHFGLSKDSVVLLEQIRTIDKRRLREKMGHLDEASMARVNDAISVSFGLGGEHLREEVRRRAAAAAAAVASAAPKETPTESPLPAHLSASASVEGTAPIGAAGRGAMIAPSAANGGTRKG